MSSEKSFHINSIRVVEGAKKKTKNWLNRKIRTTTAATWDVMMLEVFCWMDRVNSTRRDLTSHELELEPSNVTQQKMYVTKFWFSFFISSWIWFWSIFFVCVESSSFMKIPSFALLLPSNLVLLVRSSWSTTRTRWMDDELDFCRWNISSMYRVECGNSLQSAEDEKQFSQHHRI